MDNQFEKEREYCIAQYERKGFTRNEAMDIVSNNKEKVHLRYEQFLIDAEKGKHIGVRDVKVGDCIFQETYLLEE